jgi:hypothetical protein
MAFEGRRRNGRGTMSGLRARPPAGGGESVVINQRYRRSAVLRTLLSDLAGSEHRDGTERAGLEDYAFPSAGAGRAVVGPEGGEDDDREPLPRVAEAQRVI